MRRMRFWWLLVAFLLTLPYAILVLAGSIWLYQQGYLWPWLAVTGILMLAFYPVVNWLRRRSLAAMSGVRLPPGDSPQQAAAWTPAGRRAWDEVEAIARRVQNEDMPLDRPEFFWQTLHEVFRTVARQYHPEADDPSLETPLPDVLRTAELVARDLREAFSEHVPGAHILTLGDMKRLTRLAGLVRQFYFLYRVMYFGFNPFSAILREVRDVGAGKLLGTSAEEVKQWAVGFCIRKAGLYAIQLYSGQQLPDAVLLRTLPTSQSKSDAASAEAFRKSLAGEPLRILVLGQVKSGKSSLVNALFGEPRAAVDVVPRTRGVEPYLLQRDGIPRAILLDTAGYDETDDGRPPAVLREQILQCDLVLVVCSALSAARRADRRLVDGLRALFQEQPDRLMPPLVAALTHIDQLRPASEWNPPYDLAHPSGAKDGNILDAMRAVAEDLALTPDQVVVPVCLKADQLYNVEEGLAPAILTSLPEAQRVKYLRCLRHFHDAEYWQRLWRQALNSGRVLLAAGAAWARAKK